MIKQTLSVSQPSRHPPPPRINLNAPYPSSSSPPYPSSPASSPRMVRSPSVAEGLVQLRRRRCGSLMTSSGSHQFPQALTQTPSQTLSQYSVDTIPSFSTPTPSSPLTLSPQVSRITMHQPYQDRDRDTDGNIDGNSEITKVLSEEVCAVLAENEYLLAQLTSVLEERKVATPFLLSHPPLFSHSLFSHPHFPHSRLLTPFILPPASNSSSFSLEYPRLL